MKSPFCYVYRKPFQALLNLRRLSTAEAITTVLF